MHSKLIKDLPDLVEKNIISQETALNIKQYYLSQESDAPNKLFTVFGVLGSLLVGLGIILILAHNWDNFPRATKTIFAFLPLVIGQILVGYAILKKKGTTWNEASGTFLFFAVGSSIALISQIYNIPGDVSTYILTWIVLCLPLIYLLKSNVVAFLHLAFSTFYACNLGYGYLSRDESPWLFLILFVLVLPHYYYLLKEQPKSNSTSLFNFFIPMSIVITLGAFINYNYSYGFLMYVLLFGLLYNIGKIPFFDDQKLRQNGYLVFGSVGIVVMLLITSFNWSWSYGFGKGYVQTQEFYIAIVLFLITTAVLIYSYSKKWLKGFNLFQFVYIIFTVLFFIGIFNGTLTMIFINLLILTLGLITIKIGTDKFHFGILNYGLLIITSLVVFRFFDTDMSYVIRGLLFVGVGVGFFATNYIMLKRQKAILKATELENLNDKKIDAL